MCEVDEKLKINEIMKRNRGIMKLWMKIRERKGDKMERIDIYYEE